MSGGQPLKGTWTMEVQPNHLQTILGLLLFFALLGIVVYYTMAHGGAGPVPAPTPARTVSPVASPAPVSVRR